MRRILALEGGGIKGAVSSVGLSTLGRELTGDLADHFDVIAGTSTGAIEAVAIGLKIKPLEVEQVYASRGLNIFPQRRLRWWSRLGRLFVQGVSAPKYDDSGLESELISKFGAATLGDLAVPTMIATYDVLGNRMQMLTSWQHPHIPAWQAAKASASAPTYLPATMIRLNGIKIPLIDGGVGANNPALFALAEAVHRGTKASDVVLAMFGTGQAHHPITASNAGEWGLIEWAPHIVGVLMDANASSVGQPLSLMLGDRYYEFQPTLGAGLEAMDKADPEHVETLRATARAYFKRASTQRRIKQLATELSRGN